MLISSRAFAVHLTATAFLVYVILNMPSPLDQLYKTKLQLIAVLAVVGGAACLMLAQWSSTVLGLNCLAALPIAEIGSVLFSTAYSPSSSNISIANMVMNAPINASVRQSGRKPRPSGTRSSTASRSTLVP